MAVRDRSHRQLQDTWRHSSNLLGELASIIVDGSIFANFVSEEGCNSTSALKTLHQTQLSVFSLNFLRNRFKAGGLPDPRMDVMEDAVGRIRRSFDVSRKS